MYNFIILLLLLVFWQLCHQLIISHSIKNMKLSKLTDDGRKLEQIFITQ